MRPPIRFAEPGRTCAVVMPPASSRGNCGSCGQTECSAHTCAVTGLVASFPSLCACTPGRGVHAQVRVRVDQPGRDELAGPIDDDRVGRCVHGCADRGDLSVAQQDRTVLDSRPRGGEDGRIADDRRARRERRRTCSGTGRRAASTVPRRLHLARRCRLVACPASPEWPRRLMRRQTWRRSAPG